jgi:hypothetical protein
VNALEEIFGVALATPGKTQTVTTITGEISLSPDERAEEVPTTQAMSNLATRVMGNWRTNVDHRVSSGVDAKLRKALLAQTCSYTPEQKEKMRRSGISEEVFSPITNTKVRAAKAMLMDIFAANGDYPFSLRASADPELPKQCEEEAKLAVKMDIDRVFASLGKMNKRLSPKGEAVLGSLVRNAYSSRYDEIFHRREQIAKTRAARMERRVNDYFDEGGFVDAFQEYVNYVCIYGTGGILGPIPIVKEVNDYRTVKGVPKVVRELRTVPSFKAINPFDMYPAPGAKDVEDGPLCIRVEYSSHELKRCSSKVECKSRHTDKANGWMWHTVRALLDAHPNGEGCKLVGDPIDMARREAERKGAENPKDCMMEGVLCYDSVRGSELIELGITRNRSNKAIEFTKFYNVETIVIDGYVVYCRIIDDRLGRPFVKGVFYELPGSWWGESIADKLTMVQSTMNNAIKALFRNMAAASGPMYYINDISRLVDRDGTGLMVKPHKVFTFQPSMSTSLGVASGAPMGVMDVPSKAAELLQVFERMKTQADDDSGIPAYTYGQASGNSGAMRTAQGLQIFTEAASRGMKMVINTTDRLVTRRLVRKVVDYIMLYDTDFEIKGDCEVVPTGIMGKILRAQQSQERQAFIQMIQRDPDFKQLLGPKGWTALLRPSVLDLAINPDDVLPSEERIAELEKIQYVKMLLEVEQAKAQAAQAQQPDEGAQPGGMGAPAQPAPFSVAERRNAA